MSLQIKRVGRTDTVRKTRLALCDAMTDRLHCRHGVGLYEPGSLESLVLDEVISLLKQAVRLMDDAGIGD
jgi:hypothetical protein